MKALGIFFLFCGVAGADLNPMSSIIGCFALGILFLVMPPIKKRKRIGLYCPINTYIPLRNNYR